MLLVEWRKLHVCSVDVSFCVACCACMDWKLPYKRDGDAI